MYSDAADAGVDYDGEAGGYGLWGGGLEDGAGASSAVYSYGYGYGGASVTSTDAGTYV